MTDADLQANVVMSLFRGGPNAPVFSGIDSRAWRTDAFRAARLAQAALEHLPVAATVSLARPGAFEEALGFASSEAFVAVVVEQAELVHAFSTYFRGCAAGRGLAPLLDLDEALVDIGALQAAADLSPRHHQLAPACRVLHLPVGTAEWHAAQFARIQAAPGASLWERILATAQTRPVFPQPDVAETEALLVVRGGHGRTGSVETLSTEMAALLALLDRPRTLSELVAAFQDELTTEDCQEILGGLIDDGIVVRGDEARP